jgi:hypothetical protein
MGKGFGGLGPLRSILTAALLLPVSAYAIGLGPAELRSRPGEPLDLSVPVLCDSTDCDHFEVGLAGPADYRAAGLIAPQLPGVSLSYDRAADAIEVKTTRPVPEPEIHLLFDLRAGAISLRQDVDVVLATPMPIARPIGPETTQAAPPPPQGFIITPQKRTAAPAETAPIAPPVVGPAPELAPAPVATAPQAPSALASTPGLRPQERDILSQADDAVLAVWAYFRGLDSKLVARGVGIGIGVLAALVVLAVLYKIGSGISRFFSYRIGGLLYRWSGRKRQAPAAAPAAPVAVQNPAAPQVRVEPRLAPAPPRAQSPGISSRIDTPDPLVRRLHQEIKAQPGRLDLKLKLAERLYALKDRYAFADLAMELKPTLKQAAWDRLREMGKQLLPYDDRFLHLGDEGGKHPEPLLKSNW